MNKLLLIFLLLPGLAHAGEISIGYEKKSRQATKSIAFSDTVKYIDLSGEYNYGMTAGIVTEDNGRFSVGYDPILSDWFSLWLDEIVGFDKPAGIDFENMIGFGPKVYLTEMLSFSTGVLIHYQAYREAEGRYSHRLKFKSKRLKAVYFYQPNVDAGGDYISKFEGSFKHRLKEDIVVMGFDRLVGFDLVLKYFNTYRNLGEYRNEGVLVIFSIGH